ncbi:MAG: autotransporter-associated beta strand repeat-containing protein [Pirellulales bacterium]
MTIIADTLADLGAADKLIVTSAPTNTNGIAGASSTILPIVARTSTTADANFVQYAGANGFAQHSAATTGTLGTSVANSLADISLADTAGAGNIDIYAVRTNVNIAPTDGTTLVRIGGGAMIVNANGVAAPIISTNLLFGTSAAALKEAVVYVGSGQTSGTATFSGSFSAADFTKFGPGGLVISGTANSMAPATNANLRNFVVNDGTVRFAGATSLPSIGISGLGAVNGVDVSGVNLNVNELGVLDLGGQSLAFAGFSLNTVNNVATGTITNSGSAASLIIAGHNQTTTFQGAINDGSGTVGLIKSGTGLVQLNGNSTYSGGTTINAGTIVSSTLIGAQTAAAAFANMATGGLGVAEYMGMGTGSVTLSGGTLLINSARTGEHEASDGINVFTFGPVAAGGYDLIVSQNNNFGSSNTTSKIHAANAVFAAINSLTINAPALTFDGTVNTGILVRGAVTLGNATTILNTPRDVVFGGKLVGTGSGTITKIGQESLILANYDAGAAANSGITTWNLFQGDIEVRATDGSISNPLVNGSSIVINSSAILNLRHEGNGIEGLQRILTFQTNNLQFGSTAGVADAGFISSGNVAQVNVNR